MPLAVSLQLTCRLWQAWKLFCQQRELVVMGREKSTRADLGVKVFERRPSERESVEGGRAAAHFIETG